MKKFIRSIVIMAGVVASLAVQDGLTATTTDVPPSPINAKFQGFDSEWRRIVESGSPDDFLSLTNSKAGAESVGGWNDVEPALATNKPHYFMMMKVSHVYVTRHLSPWIAFADYNAPSYDVVTGGLINAGVMASWFLPGGCNSNTGTLTVGTVVPNWKVTQAFPIEGSGYYGTATGWWATKEPGQAGWLIRRYWIRVPEAVTG